ncbi:hypothetical protein CI610_02003 [invertebrate metagenome]|uniref:Uncharacterized protein n=1 Tax=invertebrate metagenome TaxID=1711999 RepID=A0A2H9T771_9ZZZZ
MFPTVQESLEVLDVPIKASFFLLVLNLIDRAQEFL